MQGVSNVFAIPGMAAAFYFTAKKENRAKVLALILPGVLTSVLAGITEPFDYTYLFLAPQLFLIHALLCGVEVIVMYTLGITGDMQGGLIEMMAKNFVPLWHNHWSAYLMFILIGLCFSCVYFFVFRFFILKFNIKTPGRSDEEIKLFTKKDYKEKKSNSVNEQSNEGKFSTSAASYISLLGGSENISDINNCVTRLRITVNDVKKVDSHDTEFKNSGAKGVLRSGNAIQIIVGMDSSNIKSAMDDLMDN